MIDKTLASFTGSAILGPVIIIAGTIVLLLLADIFMRLLSGGKRGLPDTGHVVITVLGALASAVYAALLILRVAALPETEISYLAFTANGFPDPDHKVPFWTSGAIQVDHFGLCACILICLVLILAVLILSPYMKRKALFKPEVYPLVLISGLGMMLLGFSNDLLVTFLAIEILSLPLYVLCGLDNSSRPGREASLKYFLLGAFASGFFIYGCAFIYGVAGNLNYRAVSFLFENTNEMSGMILIGFILVGIGLAFKIALVPLHAWVPDVYQGAPTPITAFMAAGVKIGVFVAAQRIIYTCFVNVPPEGWRNGLALFGAASMLVGNLFALQQISFKRLLAYSAITHTGYLCVGLCAGNQASGGSILVYLLSYGLAAIGAFGLISYLSPDGQDDIYLDEMYELSKRAPLASISLVILLLSMAGFPLTAGFIGKLLVFIDAWNSGLYALVIFAVINSVISAFFYLRVIMAMYLQPRVPGSQQVTYGRIQPGVAFAGVVSVVLTLAFGLLPQLMLDLASHGVPH